MFACAFAKKGKNWREKIGGISVGTLFCVSCSSLHVFCNGEERIGVEMEVKRVRIDSVGSPPQCASLSVLGTGLSSMVVLEIGLGPSILSFTEHAIIQAHALE